MNDTRKFAPHCAAMAIDMAWPRIGAGKISDIMIHTMGPNDMPKPDQVAADRDQAERAGVFDLEQRAQRQHRQPHDQAAEDQQRLAPDAGRR